MSCIHDYVWTFLFVINDFKWLHFRYFGIFIFHAALPYSITIFSAFSYEVWVVIVLIFFFFENLRVENICSTFKFNRSILNTAAIPYIFRRVRYKWWSFFTFRRMKSTKTKTKQSPFPRIVSSPERRFLPKPYKTIIYWQYFKRSKRGVFVFSFSHKSNVRILTFAL